MSYEVAGVLLVLGGMFLVLAQHPFVTYPISLQVLRRFYRRPLQPSGHRSANQRFAICVCAYNEEVVIRAKVENLLELRRALGELEILVYVDDATDNTAAILEEFREQITVVHGKKRAGKTVGINTLVSLTKAPIVIFTDANVTIDPASIENLKRYFRDPSVGCVCGYLTYVNPGASETAEVGSAYWALEEHIKQLESDMGSVMGADGSLFAIRRKLFRTIPADILDDMFTSLSILCDGWRVVRAPDVRAFEEQAVTSNDEFRRKIRMGCTSFNAHRVLWPRLRRLNWIFFYKYVSHKLLRWFVAYNLALAAAFFFTGFLVAMGALATAAFAGAAAAFALVLWFVKPRLIRLAFEFTAAITATAIGVAKSLKGERFQTWTPPASARGGSS
jgi:cellulose synthase/poly-beta-1,6-N-acetylglucosamine synthase-like glycosyltransferase